MYVSVYIYILSISISYISKISHSNNKGTTKYLLTFIKSIQLISNLS